MNRTKVVEAIKQAKSNAAKGPNAGLHLRNEGSMYLVEALEEIASEDNCEALRIAISMLPATTFKSSVDQLAKLRGLLISIQVPKEGVYAYPVTMERHFLHYCDKYYQGDIVSTDGVIRFKATGTDDFGCIWRHFGGPKELVEFLRKNSIPIKVIE